MESIKRRRILFFSHSLTDIPGLFLCLTPAQHFREGLVHAGRCGVDFDHGWTRRAWPPLLSFERLF